MNQRKNPSGRNQRRRGEVNSPATVRKKNTSTAAEKTPLAICNSVTSTKGEYIPAASSRRPAAQAIRGCKPERIIAWYSHAR